MIINAVKRVAGEEEWSFRNADLFTHSCERCLAASHEYGTLFQGAPE